MTTEIIEYSETEQALSLLREQYGKPFDVTTKAGMESARAARRLIKSHRVALETARKEIKEPALRRCQLIDAEAKRITAELLALEQPIDAAIQAEERRVAQEKAERERVERERVADIHRRIAEIYATIAARANDDADRIDHALNVLESFDDYGMFDEFADQAKEATQTVVAQLRTMIEQKRQAEAEAAARAEQDRISRIKGMIDEIYAMGSQAFTFTSLQLENVIASVEALNLNGFDEFKEEAMEAQDKTLYGLTKLLYGQRKNEADAARIAELERQMAEEKRRQAEEADRIRREQEAENNRVVAIKAKITQIHDIAFGGFQWNSDRLKQMIQEVEAIDPEQGFDEFKDDAIRAKIITLAELTSVLEQQQQFEEERDRIAAEREAIERAKAEQRARERDEAERLAHEADEAAKAMEAAQRQKDLDAWIDGLAEQVEAGMMTIREALLVAYRSGSGGN